MTKIKILILKIRKIIKEKKWFDFVLLAVFVLGIIIVFLDFKKKLFTAYNFNQIYKEGVYEPLYFSNPLSLNNETEKAILKIIYPTLIEFDNGKIISKFIKNYSFSNDKLKLYIELKNNLKWSNGEPLTSDDIYFSFEIFKKYSSPLNNLNFKNISLNVIDQNKIEFNLQVPDNYFLYNLNNFNIFPQKKFSGLEFDKFDIENLKIGSGPFILESVKKEGSINVLTLKRNEFYSPKPFFKKIIFYSFPSLKSAFDALILKQIDGLAGINYFELPKNIFFDYQLKKIILPRVIGIFFNSQKISDQEIENIENLLDKKQIIKSVFKNNAEIADGIFSPTVRKAFDIKDQKPKLKSIKASPTTSIEKITLITSETYFYPEITRYLKENLKLNFQILDSTKLEEAILQKNYQAILYGFNYGHPPLLESFFSKIGYNINNTEDIDLEKKFQQLSVEPGIDLIEKTEEIEQKILEKKKNIFILNPYYLIIMRKNIKGFDQYYLAKPEDRFVKIELWRIK